MSILACLEIEWGSQGFGLCAIYSIYLFFMKNAGYEVPNH